jgi:hypothetical protein
MRPQNSGGNGAVKAHGRPHEVGPASRIGEVAGSGSPAQRLTGREHALDVQRLNEQRKLDHRLQVAEHLRANAQRNGNQSLLDTADRMEQKAYDHYTSRLSRIDGAGDAGGDALPDPPAGDVPPTPSADLTTSHPSESPAAAPTSPTTEDPAAPAEDSEAATSFARRLANEERKLQHQLDVAQQLRDIATKDGNQNLIQTAERMEQMAVDRYEQQWEKLTLPAAGE